MNVDVRHVGVYAIFRFRPETLNVVGLDLTMTRSMVPSHIKDEYKMLECSFGSMLQGVDQLCMPVCVFMNRPSRMVLRRSHYKLSMSNSLDVKLCWLNLFKATFGDGFSYHLQRLAICDSNASDAQDI